MKSLAMGITRQKTREQQVIDVRNALIIDLHKADFSYGEIEKIINIDKGGASRIVRFGKNTSRKAKV
jgi:hypothetical protein